MTNAHGIGPDTDGGPNPDYNEFIETARRLYAAGREDFFRLAQPIATTERLRALAWSILGAIGEVSPEEGIAALQREAATSADAGATKVEGSQGESAQNSSSLLVPPLRARAEQDDVLTRIGQASEATDGAATAGKN